MSGCRDRGSAVRLDSMNRVTCHRQKANPTSMHFNLIPRAQVAPRRSSPCQQNVTLKPFWKQQRVICLQRFVPFQRFFG
ncbi:hypothetical protein Y1Q_0022730 [Alligator mississippiensis]|uniref:Uncharacterized protein n=1 Tax=Alligator mississippiensis TaxID=8496 RepID=A0A151N496_ALLMI|nr:hypothetical protein Y1Q_0022730 [Alligator mississippiensis]